MKKTFLLLLISLSVLFLNANFNKYIWNTGRSIDVRGELVEHKNNILTVASNNQLFVYSMFDIYNFTLNGAYTFNDEIKDIEILTSKKVAVALNTIISSKRDIDSLVTTGRSIEVRAYNGNQVVQDGTHLYLAHGDNGLTVYDMGTNLSNNIISNYHNDWGLNSIVVKWPLLYAGNAHGVATINLSNINHPLPFGQNINLFKCEKVAIYDDLLFAVSNRTLNILDISTPGKIKEKEVLYFPYTIRNVKVQGNELFVVLGEGGLEVYTIKSDYTLEHATSYNDGYYLYDIAFYQDYLFMLSKDKNLRILQYR